MTVDATEATADVGTGERIRRAAAALFREKGFNGTSMADLAAAVGITKSSLYHHFSSKQALLLEILELTVDRVTPALRAVAESERPATERLRRAVVMHVVEGLRDRDNLACFVEEGRYLEPAYMEAYVAKRDRYEHYVRRIIRDGIASGEFRPVDPRLTAMAILGMANSAVRWYRPEGDYTPEEIGASFAELVVDGLLAGGAPT